MPEYSRVSGSTRSAYLCLECGALISPLAKFPQELHDAWNEKMEGRMEKEVTPVEPGDRLYGFCGGAFGRDTYGEKIVLAVGKDWVVAHENGRPIFAAVSPEDLALLRAGSDE